MVRPGLTVTERACAGLTAPVPSEAVTEKMKGVAAATTGAVPLRVEPVRVSHAGSPAAAKLSVPVPLEAARV